MIIFILIIILIYFIYNINNENFNNTELNFNKIESETIFNNRILLKTTNPNLEIEQNLNFSIYNVLARQNPFCIYFETTGDLSKFSIQTKAKQVSLFTILPSISWKVVFK